MGPSPNTSHWSVQLLVWGMLKDFEFPFLASLLIDCNLLILLLMSASCKQTTSFCHFSTKVAARNIYHTHFWYDRTWSPRSLALYVYQFQYNTSMMIVRSTFWQIQGHSTYCAGTASHDKSNSWNWNYVQNFSVADAHLFRIWKSHFGILKAIWNTVFEIQPLRLYMTSECYPYTESLCFSKV